MVRYLKLVLPVALTALALTACGSEADFDDAQADDLMPAAASQSGLAAGEENSEGLGETRVEEPALADPKILTRLLSPMQDGPFAPRSDCGGLDGEHAFRVQLARIAEGRDKAALLALTSDNIKLDFGGGAGRASLDSLLSSDEAGNLWRALDELLPLGCAAQGGESLVIPWFFAQDLGVDDPIDAYVVTGQNVAFFETASGIPEEIDRLSWEAVELIMEDDNFPDMKLVRRSNGMEGFIENTNLRRSIDYRVVADKSDSGWKITAFIAGD